MCLVLTAWQTHPQYPLVVLANRDEFYERPTEPMNWWKDYPHILAGKDKADVLGESGTWMGINKNGKFAALTNIRSPNEKNPTARTRGEITAKYLINQHTPEEFITTHEKSFSRYNGFNFLATDLSQKTPQLIWLSNRIWMGDHFRARKIVKPQQLSPGLYGLSNGTLDSPWPKVQHRISAFAQLLAMDTGEFKKADQYLHIMEDPTQAPDEKLPQTGVSYEWEKTLSSAFIKTELYGTRSISLIRVRHDGHFEVMEKCFDAQKELGLQVFEGQLQQPPLIV